MLITMVKPEFHENEREPQVSSRRVKRKISQPLQRFIGVPLRLLARVAKSIAGGLIKLMSGKN